MVPSTLHLEALEFFLGGGGHNVFKDASLFVLDKGERRPPRALQSKCEQEGCFCSIPLSYCPA